MTAGAGAPIETRRQRVRRDAVSAVKWFGRKCGAEDWWKFVMSVIANAIGGAVAGIIVLIALSRYAVQIQNRADVDYHVTELADGWKIQIDNLSSIPANGLRAQVVFKSDIASHEESPGVFTNHTGAVLADNSFAGMDRATFIISAIPPHQTYQISFHLAGAKDKPDILMASPWGEPHER
jgi:hypothetical protein